MSEAPRVLPQPEVAVLMCVHRGADPAQFDEALASMRAQTHRNLRLFVYCDGPLLAAHDEVIERRLRLEPGADVLVRTERPAGLPTGLNRLIELALAEPAIAFMARMDADDLSVPQRIERQLAYLVDHPDVSIVGTWCIEFTDAGVPLFHKKMPTGREDVSRSMVLRNALAHPTVMFRRAVFEQGHRYDPRLLMMQDYELWSRLILAKQVISNVPEYLLWFRMGSGFFDRRRGLKRAWDEVNLRLQFSKRSGQLTLARLVGLGALFCVRVMPGSIRRLVYKHRR